MRRLTIVFFTTNLSNIRTEVLLRHTETFFFLYHGRFLKNAVNFVICNSYNTCTDQGLCRLVTCTAEYCVFNSMKKCVEFFFNCMLTSLNECILENGRKFILSKRQHIPLSILGEYAIDGRLKHLKMSHSFFTCYTNVRFRRNQFKLQQVEGHDNSNLKTRMAQ